jgi:hypothetical protein
MNRRTLLWLLAAIPGLAWLDAEAPAQDLSRGWPPLPESLPPRPSPPPPPIRYLGDLQVLTVQPGDRFVLMLDTEIGMEAQERLREYWTRFAGEGVPLLVLGPGGKLGAIRTEDANH